MRIIALLATCCCIASIGCGSAPATAGADCKPVGFLMVLTSTVSNSGLPDHSAMPPGNQEHFYAGLGTSYGPGCVSNQLYRQTNAQWSTSDPQNVSISSSDDAANGQATCTGATAATVTAILTSYGFTESRTANITCK